METMRLSQVTGRKSKAPLSTAKMITIVIAVIALILTGLNLYRETIETVLYAKKVENIEIRAVEVVELPQGLPAVDVVELSRELPVVDVVDVPLELPAVDVVELSRGLPAVDPSSNITTALCCRAMFGNVDLSRVALWVAYYRLLGFYHVFLFHQDVIADYPGFDKLKSLPYLTLTQAKGEMIEYRDKSQTSNGTSIPYWRFVGADNQYRLEKKCFNKYAKGYDWVMIADIDEYLSFNEEMGVKDFIAKYSDDSTKSLGFGKYMYTLTARVDTVDSGFGLDMYAFTPGIYCTPKLAKFRMKSRKKCTGFFGSTKLIVRPQNHTDGINVHGPRRPRKKWVKYKSTRTLLDSSSILSCMRG
jgi:hypothetical protein